MRVRQRYPVLTALALCLAAAPAAAQNLRGQVVDDDTGAPLEGVHVVLLDADDAISDEGFTDDEGRFALRAPEAGTWVVAADFIGYGSVGSDPIDVGREEQLTLEIRMSVEAVPLEPVVVTSRRSHFNPDIQDFYERAERGGSFGIGRFITREDIALRMTSHPSDLLRTVPGIRVVPGRRGASNKIEMTRGCTPAIYLDGIQINRVGSDAYLDELVATSSIEGIEIYRGAVQQAGRYYDSRGCGLILVWTRRGSDEGKPLTWGRVLAAASIVLGILLLN